MSPKISYVGRASKNWFPWQRPLRDRRANLRLIIYSRSSSTNRENLAKIGSVDFEIRLVWQKSFKRNNSRTLNPACLSAAAEQPRALTRTAIDSQYMHSDSCEVLWWKCVFVGYACFVHIIYGRHSVLSWRRCDYVLPVRMTSYFHIIGYMAECRYRCSEWCHSSSTKKQNSQFLIKSHYFNGYKLSKFLASHFQ